MELAITRESFWTRAMEKTMELAITRESFWTREEETMHLEIIHEPSQNGEEKTPILFIHGAFNGAWMWQDNFMQYFADQGHPTYALSLRGHGQSEGRKRLQRNRLADYVKDVKKVIRQLDGEPVLVGHSMGGYIVQKCLESYDAPAAVLMASIPPYGGSFASLRMCKQDPAMALKIGRNYSFNPSFNSPKGPPPGLFSDRVPRKVVEQTVSRFQDESLLACFDMILPGKIRTKKVKTPILVIGAEKDGLIFPKDVRATAATYQAPYKIFPEMGHAITPEPNWPDIADFMKDWFETTTVS